MVVAQRVLAPLQRLAVVGLCLAVSPLRLQQEAQVVDRPQRVRVVVAQRATGRLQRFTRKRRRTLVSADGQQQTDLAVDRRNRVGVLVAQVPPTDLILAPLLDRPHQLPKRGHLQNISTTGVDSRGP
jgi:hypothetical protein